MQALMLSPHQEVRLPNGLLATIAAAQDPNAPSPTRYLNLTDDGDSRQEDEKTPTFTIKETSIYWHLSGRSAPFTKDTELGGVNYKAGSHIDYSVSSSCSEWATHKFLTEWSTPNLQGDLINGWAVLALADILLDHQELTDPDLKATSYRRAPMRPVYVPHTPKSALISAFEAFAARRRQEYEQRDELEDEG